MSAAQALLPLAIFISHPAAEPRPIAEVAISAIFELCVPLISDESFDKTAWLKHWGASKGTGADADRATYALPTSDAGLVEVIILADRSVCGLRYVGNYGGVAAVAGQLAKSGWEGRSALAGQVWRKERTFAVTAWAPEKSEGAHEGTASVVRPDSEVAPELAKWFSPAN
jgi:hypothetical protein